MDIIHEEKAGDIEAVVLLNFMVEINWVLTEVPLLRRKDIPVLILHGYRDEQDANTGAYSLRFPNEVIHECYSKYNVLLRQIKVDDQYGSAHAKVAVIFYKTGVRVAIHTSNYIAIDFNYKTQGVYVQDFPLITTSKIPSKQDPFPFGNELTDFFNNMVIFDRSGEDDRTSLRADAKRLWREYQMRLHQYDYSSAEVVLIPSAPGRWKGVDSEGKLCLHKYGHMKLRSVLGYYKMGTSLPDRSLAMQISSIGSMGKDEKKLEEIVSSMGGSLSSLKILWPTAECVRTSCIGYASGNSIPCHQETIYENGRLKYSFANCMHKWVGNSPIRTLYTPHIKTYFQYKSSGSNPALVTLDWFLLTSSNLSQAAWGVLEKDKTQLFLKSFELGVLYLPQRVKTPFRVFSLTPTHPRLGFDTDNCKHNGYSSSQRRFVVSMELVREITESSDIHFPIPFQIPPEKYSSADVPWTNIPHATPDRFNKYQ